MSGGSARGGRTGVAVLLALGGGLGLVGSATGAWISTTVETTIADVPREEEVTTPGVELVGFVLPVGVLVLAAGLLLVVLRGRARSVLGAVLGAAGVTALAGVGVGLVRAAQETGAIGAAAWFALVAALATIAAGAITLRPAPPPELSARYDLDAEDSAESEWRLASAEDPDDQGAPDDLA